LDIVPALDLFYTEIEGAVWVMLVVDPALAGKCDKRVMRRMAGCKPARQEVTDR
jgi:hypothetical protein